VPAGHRTPGERAPRCPATLPIPVLGEAVGGGTGLVDVGVDRGPFGETVHPGADDRVAECTKSAAASRPSTLEEHTESYAIADLLAVARRGLLGPRLLLQADVGERAMPASV
jgi:hypothetical protein